eukprot:6202923-Pleurochrysis_carterae.AAC.5
MADLSLRLEATAASGAASRSVGTELYHTTGVDTHPARKSQKTTSYDTGAVFCRARHVAERGGRLGLSGVGTKTTYRQGRYKSLQGCSSVGDGPIVCMFVCCCEVQELLGALLAPPYSRDINEVATAAEPRFAGTTPLQELFMKFSKNSP